MSATLSFVHQTPKYVERKRRCQKVSSDKDVQFKLNKIMSLLNVSREAAAIIDLTRKTCQAGRTGQGDAQPLSRFSTVATLVHVVHRCKSPDEKDFVLYYFIRCYAGKTLVFCNSIDCVRRLANLFRPLCDVHCMHAQMHQRQRLKNWDRFTCNPRGVLIASDVAARGIDIVDIDHVIHYQVPKTCETYIHRSGRTARAGKKGIALTLVSISEEKQFNKIQHGLQNGEQIASLSSSPSKQKSSINYLDVDRDLLATAKLIVGVARELDKLKLDARRENVDRCWSKRVALEADLIVSDDQNSDDDVCKVQKLQRGVTKAIKSKERELASLIAQPRLTSTNSNLTYSGGYPTASGKLVIPKSMFNSVKSPVLPI